MTISFDVVIVGAGSAGCVLAARLSELPGLRVCLIEAGSSAIPDEVRDPLKWPALQGSSIDWGYKSVPQASCGGRIHDWPRGKILGGSSAINAMAHMRGHPSDFDAWTRSGATGWGFDDLLPYFIRAESSPIDDPALHGTGGPLHLIQPDPPHPLVQAFRAAAIEHGLSPIAEHNGRRMDGPSLNTLTIRDGRRQTVADAYLSEAVRARFNLTVMTDSTVERLVVANGACRSLQMRTPYGPQSVEARRQVILSAGTIGSPILLQRSGLGDAAQLAAAGIAPVLDLPGVGHNLHDHLLAGGNLYRARRAIAPSRYQHSESVLYIRLPDGGPAPDIAIACLVAPVVTEQFEAPPVGTSYTFMFGATHPRSRGSIAVVSPDPDSMPRIDPAYLSDPYDRQTALAALDWARKLGRSTAMADWFAEELLPSPADMASPGAREAFLEKAAYTHHHPVGTCRMGQDDLAVVGPDLQLRGIDGLSVVDASVIPCIPTGPVNAAVVAIAEKASDMFAERVRQ